MRRDFLKAYVMQLVADGELSLEGGLDRCLSKLWACAAQDLRAVFSDLASMAAAHGVRAAADRLARAVEDGGVAEVLRQGLAAAARASGSSKAGMDELGKRKGRGA